MAKKKSKLVTGAIYELGLQLLAHPDGVDTWVKQKEYIRGNWNFFHHADCRIAGRVRIPVSSYYHLIEHFKQDLQYTEIRSDGVEGKTVVNAVLVDFMCRNIGLSAPGSSRKPKRIEVNLDEKKFLETLREQIGTCLRDDLAWDYLDDIVKRGMYFFGFAVLLVDDLSKFQKKVEEVASVELTKYDSGILAFHLGSGSEELKFPLYRLGMSDLQLFVLEDREVNDWLESGVRSKGPNDLFERIRTHIDYVLYSNRLRVIQYQIIMISGRCTALLESLPEHKPISISAREELMRKLTGISDALAYYRSTHLLARNYFLNEKNVKVPEFIKPEPDRETLEGELDILGDHLKLIDETLQTRLMIENMTVSHSREEQQKRAAEQQERAERSLQLLSITVSIFIIFEIWATLWAWWLSPADPISWFLWGIPILLLATGLIFVGLEYRKTTSIETKKGE